MMTIEHEKSENKGTFFISEDGETLAEMTYSMAGDGLMIIDHTAVSDKLSGKGAGKKLVLEGVAFARKRHLKILPLCPFAKSVFQRNTELHDVLRK